MRLVEFGEAGIVMAGMLGRTAPCREEGEKEQTSLLHTGRWVTQLLRRGEGQ